MANSVGSEDASAGIHFYAAKRNINLSLAVMIPCVVSRQTGISSASFGLDDERQQRMGMPQM